MKQLPVIALSLCVLAVPCLAQDAGLKPVAPVLRDSTVGVICIDMKAVAASDAFFKKFADISSAVAGKDAKLAQDVVRKWLDDFVKAGGTSLYMVVQMQAQPTPLLVVPLAKDADVQKMAAVFEAKSYDEAKKAAATRPKDPQMPPGFDATDWEDVYIVKDGAFIFGLFRDIKALGVTQPAQRADLAKALAAAPQAPVRAAFVPPAMLMAMLPDKMPASAPAEGLNLQPLKKVSFVAGAMTLPPDMTVSLTIATADAQSAKDVEKVIRGLLGAVTKEAGVLELAPKFAELPSMMTIAPKDDQVKITADAKQVQKIIDDIVIPMLNAARERARKMQSVGHLKSLGIGMYMYAKQNDGQLPKDLQDLVKAKLADAAMLKNPSRPDLDVGYVYIRQPSADEADPDLILAYEKYDTWPRLGVAYLHAGFNVSTEKDEAKFKQMLEKSLKASKAAK